MYIDCAIYHLTDMESLAAANTVDITESQRTVGKACVKHVHAGRGNIATSSLVHAESIRLVQADL